MVGVNAAGGSECAGSEDGKGAEMAVVVGDADVGVDSVAGDVAVGAGWTSGEFSWTAGVWLVPGTAGWLVSLPGWL